MARDFGIHTIDCNYIYPRVACAYLVESENEAAYIENNTVFAVPALLERLASTGLAPEQVRWIIITHVHLDHAGGTAELLRHCPNATVLAHPRASRHLSDPSRLVRSAEQVYGSEHFAKLYGTIEPVPAERIRSLADEEEVRLGARTFRFLHTRGHANHHFVVHDDQSEGVFTGDAFGIAYPDLQTDTDCFVYPSTTPTDFHAEEARRSVERICATGAKRLYLTHFGCFERVAAAREQMLAGLDRMEALLREATDTELSGEQLQEFCERGVRAYFESKLAQAGRGLDESRWQQLMLDVGINAMGIAFAAGRARAT